MGNHQQHEEIQRQLNELTVVQKNSHHSILKSNDGTEYIKFLYTAPGESSTQNKDSKSNSIFNSKYLQFRFQSQKQPNKMDMLPRLVAFGEEIQSRRIISCSAAQQNFVVFQHPVKTLKQQVENRIASGIPFLQRDLLSLIKSVCESLSQYFYHITSWNEELLEKKTFSISQENIYLTHNGHFMLSDFLSNFNQIQQISKQQVTLRKNSRASSMTNLHAKMTAKKIKQKYFESNFSNLASIIESIIFKFQCFNQPSKNSQQSQSILTALQSHRGPSKTSPHYSSKFEKILKQLRQRYTDENKIIENVDRILTPVHLPTPWDASEDSTNLIEGKSFIQKNAGRPSLSQQQNLNGINSFINYQESKPLSQISIQNLHISKAKDHMAQKENNFIESKRPSHHFLQKDSQQKNDSKSSHKHKTKLRLSLKKKESQVEKSIQSRQNSEEKPIMFQRKSSHPKFLCSKNNEIQQKGKQNCNISIKINTIGFPQLKRTISSLNAQKLTQKLIGIKLDQNLSKSKQTFFQDRKKVFLKKPNKEEIIVNEQRDIKRSKEKTQAEVHLNPMSRKKAMSFTKFLNCKSKQTSPIFKTAQKIPNEMDMELIENLSSIMSNQNNTISSVGIPMTDEFKTDNSIIQEQGCIGFNQIEDLPSTNVKSMPDDNNNQFSKKNSASGQSPTKHESCAKLSSYLSLQLVESLIEKPEDKIPEFLKKFKLPEKHLLALNNIILTQKDVIVQESFEQSDFNSIRQSIPNILCLDDQVHDSRKRISSKIISQKLEQMIKKESRAKNICGLQNGQFLSNIGFEAEQGIKQVVYFSTQDDSVERALKFIEVSFNNNIDH